MNKSSLDSRLKSVANRREELRRRSRQDMAKRGNPAAACARPTRASSQASSSG
jgi:hypothetical protein